MAKGKLELAYSSDAGETDKLQISSAGSFVLVPARALHFDGAREDTPIIGVARAPWATTYLDEGFKGSAGTA